MLMRCVPSKEKFLAEVAELTCACPTSNVPLYHRSYSIANSPLEGSSIVRIVYALVEKALLRQDGQTVVRRGFCTAYLESLRARAA